MKDILDRALGLEGPLYTKHVKEHRVGDPRNHSHSYITSNQTVGHFHLQMRKSPQYGYSYSFEQSAWDQERHVPSHRRLR